MITHHTYSDASPACKGELWLPEKPVTADTPKIMLIHGGGWWHGTADFMAGVADRFCREGYIVFNIDYRVTTEAPWPACGDDCLAAADFFVRADAEEIRVTAGKPIVVCGVSAGGHLALMTGLRMPREQVLGIISIAGIADPEPDAAAFPERYEKLFAGGPIDPQAFPAPYLRKDSPPILLTHCLNDVIVPRESAYRFARYATELGADIHTYFYDLERVNDGHAIWIPGSSPHRLYPDVEEAVTNFARDCFGLPRPIAMENDAVYLGKLQPVPSQDITGSAISIGFECLDRGLYNPALCYDKLQAAGVKHARVQTGWCKCETVKGVYDFAWLDDVVDNLLRRGILPWFNVGYGNKLYMDDVYGETAVGHVPLYYGEECLEAWKRYCHALAEHFKDRITHYEIWNETNHNGFWQPKKADPAEYARLLDLTQEQIRRAHPEAKIGACVAGFRNEYMDSFARQEWILPKLDFFSIHSYASLPDAEYAECIRYLRRLFRAHGGGHIQVWQGEGGYPHWVPEGYWQKRAHRESYLAQANWLMRRFLIDHALEIELSSFYMTVDFMEKSYQTGRSTHDPFQVQRQGVLNGICYTPKPSYHALAHVAALFQHHPRPHDAMITCSMGRTRPPTVELPHLEEVALWRKLFVRDDGVQLLTYYMPVSIEYPFQEISDFTLFLHDEPGLPPMENPVLVDLLTGDVWKLSYRRDKYSLVFEGLPLSSTPRVIMDGGKLPPVMPAAPEAAAPA